MNKIIATSSALLVLFTLSNSLFAASFDERFSPLDMNYALPQWTTGDEWAVEVQYSFKYSFYDCNELDKNATLHCNKDDDIKFNIYFKYTGEFDFYYKTRESGPVINRLSNPAFHLLWQLPKNKTFKWFDIGLEHNSDGQTTSANKKDEDTTSATYGQYITKIENNIGNHKYFDTLSRSADYISLSLGGKHGSEDRDKFSLIAKVYDDGEESNITWGSLAGTNTQFKDYDLININFSSQLDASYDHFKNIVFGAEYKVGLQGFNTDSIDLNLITLWQPGSGWQIPLLLRVHLGPMDRLSNYTQSINSFGLGVAFSY